MGGLAPARSRVPCIRTTSVAERSHADGYRKKINKVSLNKLVSVFAAPPQKTTYSSILSIPEVAVLGPGCLLNSYASIRYTQYAVQRGSARCKAQRGSAQDQSRTSRFCRCIPGCVTSCCCCFKQEPLILAFFGGSHQRQHGGKGSSQPMARQPTRAGHVGLNAAGGPPGRQRQGALHTHIY